jgi:hypothetical protein
MAKKATSSGGLQEDRTRVSLFLPSPKNADIRAIRKVVSYLGQQRTSKTCPVTGWTSSVYPNCPFMGIWWSPRKHKWVPEKVTVLIIDYVNIIGDKQLDDALGRLKQAVHNSYKSVGREQDVIWIVAQPVLRYA